MNKKRKNKTKTIPKKQTRDKIKFDICIESLSNLPRNADSKLIYYNYKCGKNSGSSKRVMIDESVATWDEQISDFFLSLKLIDEQYEEKTMKFEIKQIQGSKSKIIAKTDINLSAAVNMDNFTDFISYSYPLKYDDAQVLLNVKIRAIPVKLDNRSILREIKEEDVKKKTNVIKRGGRLYETKTNPTYSHDGTSSEGFVSSDKNSTIFLYQLQEEIDNLEILLKEKNHTIESYQIEDQHCDADIVKLEKKIELNKSELEFVGLSQEDEAQQLKMLGDKIKKMKSRQKKQARKLTKLKILLEDDPVNIEETVQTEKNQTPDLRLEREVNKMLQDAIYFSDMSYTSDGVPKTTEILYDRLSAKNLFTSSYDLVHQKILDSLTRASTKEYSPNKMSSYCYYLQTIVVLYLEISSSDRDDMYVIQFLNDLHHLFNSILNRIFQHFTASLTSVIPVAFFEEDKTQTVSYLNNLLSQQLHLFKEYRWYQHIVSHFFVRVASFIDKQIFTEVSNKEEYCTLSNLLNMKMKMYTLQEWFEKYEKLIGAVSFDISIESSTIISVDKHILIDESFRQEVAPHLTTSQIVKLLQVFTPDEYCPEPIPQEVIDEIELQISGKDIPSNPSIKMKQDVWTEFNTLEQLEWIEKYPKV